MKPKTLKALWTIIAIIGIISMVALSIMPALL